MTATGLKFMVDVGVGKDAKLPGFTAITELDRGRRIPGLGPLRCPQ